MTVFDLVNNKIPEHQHTIISGLAAQKFGLANLHCWQMEAIVATLVGRDSIIIQPTGSGKSFFHYSIIARLQNSHCYFSYNQSYDQ